MNAGLRVAAGTALAAGLTLALAALSRLPHDLHPEASASAVLRLSWRARAPVVVSCRPLTESERASLPPHMQRPEVCERRPLPYRLEAWVDGRRVVGETLAARADRPLYVSREAPIPPGPHALRVVFRPLAPARLPDGEGSRVPSPWILQTRIRAKPRAVVLVRYDEEAGRLALGPAGDLRRPAAE